MAEINTIARPYAEAVFRVAKPEDRSIWLGQLEQLAEVASNPMMRSVIGDPRLSSAQIYSVIDGVVKPALQGFAKNFVETLIDNGRIEALPEIAVQFRELVNNASGTADAVIYSAFAIEDAQLKVLVAALEKRFARKIIPEVVVDQSLIGGVRVVVGDQVLDSSVRGKLDDMRVALAA
jgi:F-type H+-transporting ATPase subunit delta